MDPASRSERAARLAVALFSVMIAVSAAWRLQLAWAFNTDDAFITLRYARHLADGAGITWNVGEPPVEGYSNFSFVLLGAALLHMGLDPLVGLKWLCVLALFATCGVLYWIARRWVQPALALLPALWLTRYDGTVLWTVSGLETALFQLLWVLSTAFAIASLGYPVADAANRRPGIPNRRRLHTAAGLALLASLTRPEGPVLAGIIMLALGLQLALDERAAGSGDKTLLRRGYLRAIVGFALAFGVPYAAYTAFRWLYFGDLLPNTVRCKSLYDGPADLLVRPYIEYAWPFALVALTGIPRMRDARAALLLAPVLFFCAILTGVDPIIGYLNRHFLTAHALLLVAAAVGCEVLLGLFRRRAERWRGIALLAVCIWAGLLPDVGFHPRAVRDLTETYAERSLLRGQLAKWLDAHLEPDERYLIGDCGLVPYETRARVIDAYCLNSVAMTSPSIHGDTARYVDWILHERPEVIVVHSSHPEHLVPRPEYGFYRALLSREALVRDYRPGVRFSAPHGVFHYFVLIRRDVARTIMGAARNGD